MTGPSSRSAGGCWRSAATDLSGAWIAGTVDEVAEQLATFRDAGLARVMCQHMLHTDVDMVALIGEDLAPML